VAGRQNIAPPDSHGRCPGSFFALNDVKDRADRLSARASDIAHEWIAVKQKVLVLFGIGTM